MSGAGMRLEGAGAAIARFTAIAAGLDHAEPMYADIGASLVTSTQNRFERGVDPDGNPWPPSLRAIATGGKTLIDRGRLMQSQSFNAWATGVEVGTNVVYAAAHQLGATIDMPGRMGEVHFKRGKRGKRLKGFRKASKANEHMLVAIGPRQTKVPARPFLGIDSDDAREIISIGEAYVARLAGGAAS